MPYKILMHDKADKKLSKLEKGLQERIKKSLKRLEKYPEKHGYHLKNSKFWKLRIGDYRAIYEIRKEEEKLVVFFIGHGKNVYDDFSKLF